MKKEYIEIGDISGRKFFVRELSRGDVYLLQIVTEKCGDYFQLLEGMPVEENKGEEEYYSLPHGKLHDDKVVMGVFDEQGDIIGFVDALLGYPDDKTVWIGLLILIPDSRGKGIGEAIVDFFTTFARKREFIKIMIGVIEDNEGALNFWKKNDFQIVRLTEKRIFGKKLHRVMIMERILIN